MTSNVIAIKGPDGRWMPAQPQAADQRNMIDPNKTDVDLIADHIGQICRIAQGLSERDALRARELVYACSSFLSATTRLPGPDQALFEKAIRGR